MPNSLRPHGLQPTRLLCPWDFLGTGTGVGYISQSVSSVAQSCPTLCDPMNRSTPGLPVCHHLQELTQTHVHRVGDAFQPSHPLSSPSPAFNLSQHQGLFKRVSSSHQVTKVFLFTWFQSWYVIKCLYITKKEKLSNRNQGSFTKGMSTYLTELRSSVCGKVKHCGRSAVTGRLWTPGSFCLRGE